MLSVTQRLLAVAAFYLCMLVPVFVNADSLDNKGKEFILAFLPNYQGQGARELHLTSDAEAEVTVEYPLNSPTFMLNVFLSVIRRRLFSSHTYRTSSSRVSPGRIWITNHHFF